MARFRSKMASNSKARAGARKSSSKSSGRGKAMASKLARLRLEARVPDSRF